jgi:HlyD family secretion protein
MNLLSDIWSVLTPAQRRWVAWTQFLSIVMAFSTVIGIAAIAPFFAVLGDPRLIDAARPLHWLYFQFGFSTTRGFEVALGLAFVTAVVAANVVNILGAFLMVRLSYRISAELQSTLLGEYLARPYAFHVKTNSAILYNNIIHESNRVSNDILQSAFPLVTNVITAALIVFSVMVLNPAIASVMIGALAGGYVLIYLAVRQSLTKSGEVQSHLLVEQAKNINESLGAIKEILVLRVQDFFRGNFERSSRALAKAAAHGKVIYQTPKYFMECVTVAAVVLVALFASGRSGDIGPWLGQLTFVGFAAYRLLPTLQQVFASVVRIRSEQAAFAAIAPDLRLARARKRVAVEVDPVWQSRPRNDIRLQNVSFRYDPIRPTAIADVSLKIAAGTAVGFVGPNGSGKTTLVDLIAGLLVPGSGSIAIDGVPLDEANRLAWQSRIAYVPQNIFLTDSSIAENIALGIEQPAIDRTRLAQAVELAQLDEFVSTLPDAVDHAIGEHGIQLSGGQRQRIGIARALYTDASVLILDEATNALDGLTEQELMTTIMRLRGRYTIILIAHRLSSVRACDAIFEFDLGSISNAGTYTELIRNSESFRRLVEVS